MNTALKLPIYAKVSLLLIGLYVFISILSIAQPILLPLIFATIIAILVRPLVNFLEKKKMNRTLSIAIVLIFSFLLIAGLVVLVASQATRLIDALPQLIDKFQKFLLQAVTWASGYFNISAEAINEWFAKQKEEMMTHSSAAIGSTLTMMGTMMVAAALTPVYIFMLLYYQPHLVESIHKIFGIGNDKKVTEIFTETKTIIQSYLVGLFIEFAIVATLNAVGLLIIGIDYAILLGIIVGLLNIIPYLGAITGVVIFMMIALVTKSPIYVLYVFLLYTIIQLIDNNYIVPKIVGSKVKLNALVCIFAVIAGAALWGIPGMFLAIPLTAIIKLIIDHIEPLKPWGFLLGDTMPPIVKLKSKLPGSADKSPGFFARFRRKK